MVQIQLGKGVTIEHRNEDAENFLASQEGQRLLKRLTASFFSEGFVRNQVKERFFANHDNLTEFEEEFWRLGLGADYAAVNEKYFSTQS